MSENIPTDRIAFRVESTVIDGGAQVSFSGFFEPDSTIEEKDKIVDELMAVAERQRAKHFILQLEAERDAKQRVVDQEKVRLGKVLADAETQAANGGLQDATKNAAAAAQQNIQRREEEVLVVNARIDAIRPLLREAAKPEGV